MTASQTATKRRELPALSNGKQWPAQIARLREEMKEIMRLRNRAGFRKDPDSPESVLVERQREKLDGYRFALARSIITELVKDQPDDVRRFVTGFLVDVPGAYDDSWCDWWATEQRHKI